MTNSDEQSMIKRNVMIIPNKLHLFLNIFLQIFKILENSIATEFFHSLINGSKKNDFAVTEINSNKD